MPNGPADNSPSCPRCGLHLRARGCTAERCNNPEGAAELERLRAETYCECDACTGPGGPHARDCLVHDEAVGVCDCREGT